MAPNKVIAICLAGGEFETDAEGLLSYKGGDAHAMEVDDAMKFTDFNLEVSEMFNCDIGAMCIKYFCPGNKKTLISISNAKDLKRMIKIHDNCDTVDIYVMTKEIVAPDTSNILGSRSSRTTLSEAEVPVSGSPTILNHIVDDINEPSLMLDASFDVVGDTNYDDAHIDMATEMSVAVVDEMPLPISVVGSSNIKLAKAAEQWQNTITGVGQRFNSVHEFREALRKYAIAHQFSLKYKKNENLRVTVNCKAEGCPWRIHASRLSTTPLFCIKKMNPIHTCEGSTVKTGCKATRSWVASIIKEKLKVFPNYKPKDIVDDIKQEYGIQLNYCQAWRCKETAKEQLQGSYKHAYNQLPFFCEKIMETNPGSLATFATKEDSSFHRLFVSFHASLHGFERGCRPLLFLDSVYLNSKYQGTLLSATTVDGDDGCFPVAFAVVDTETDENWYWFLKQLKSALSTCHGLTFVADREKGLRQSINEVFQGENACHGFCLHYLSERLVRDLKGQISHEMKRFIVEDFYRAAHAPTPESFHRCMDSVKNTSLDAYNWIMQSEPVHWANSFFDGARYNHMDSNFGELFYSWVSDAHELPITQMVDRICVRIMETIYSRSKECDEWLTRLTPSMERKMENESLKIRNLQVLLSAGNRFEVRGDSIESVDVDNCDCSCRGWQLTGLPCCHAISVINCLGRDPYDYCSKYFTTDSYKVTYSESVHPISNVDVPPQKGNSQLAVTVTPPTRRPPGRPSLKKVGSQDGGKRVPQCSRCKGTGHNKSSCKELLLDC